MEKFLCIHGHFYQPPRENPWLESVEVQDSAYPYHDWNERITAECYAPNATARILNGEGKIDEITSNYSKISFNFGPTLLAWMKDKMPDIHEAIIKADKLSRERFSGHGSAMAQVYNHMILPLANARDKYTQVLWGIRDFEYRFGRPPEGMWLSETATDIETLDTLAQLGIKFTVLSPFQASRTREMGKRNWKDANGAQIDPTRPYLVKLPQGRTLAVFFYDAPVSQAIAFEKLLTSGEKLAQRLTSAFNDERSWEQLVHIATDGESYGHHHRHGEMALAFALQNIEANKLARLTVYGEYLEKHAPTHEVQIHEKSAWSCSHGVGRWMADCGCNSGGHAGWNQGWRAPLRNALDWLRDELAPLFENKATQYLKDPWKSRNDYISLMLDRSSEKRDKFFVEQAHRELNEADKVTVLKLLELQRHAMLMYTSCGWFFDEISGIESVQVVQYAARALQLAREVLGKDLEPGFLERFDAARSNIPANGGGRTIYEKFVQPAMIDWPKAMAHYAISSVFHEYAPKTRIFSFSVEDEDRQLFSSGKTRLAIGRAKIISEITCESDILSYAILYMGEHNLTGGVRKFDSAEAYEAMVREIRTAYEAADFPETIRVIDRHFGQASYSLKSLFKDEQRRILNEILASTREDLESRFRLITERYEPLVKFLRGAGAPPPAALETVSELVLHSDIRREIEAERTDPERLRSLMEQARAYNGRVLDAEISFSVKNKMERLIRELAEKPEEVEQMASLERLAEIVMPVPLGLNLWRVQDSYWEMLQKLAPQFRERAQGGDQSANMWVAHFASLGERLGFANKQPPDAAPAVKLAA
jgi:alpha-amylase/alpha-mannosidase (GH57 family)